MDAWARVSVIGIEILTVEARVVVSSVDTYLRYADAIGQTALAAAPAGQQGEIATGGQQGGNRQPQLPSPDGVVDYLEDHPQGVQVGELQAYFDAPRDDLAHVVQDLVADQKVREDEDNNLYLPSNDNKQEG